MNAMSLVSPDFFNLHASSYAGRPVKVEKSEPLSFHYKKVSHSVFTTKIHWGALSWISGVY
jgi:hypothetical protein